MNTFRKVIFCTVMLIVAQLSACISAGTHGSIKAYQYPVTKVVLQGAVDKVIENNSKIKRGDTTKKSYIIDITDGARDTIFSKHPNGEAYVSISIKNEDMFNDYTFQYVGDEKTGEMDKTSRISIAYAHDKDGNGGSEGNGDFPWYKPALKRKLVGLFESELIEMVDKELGVKHTEE